MAYMQYVQCGICGLQYILERGHTCSPVNRVLSSLEGIVEPTISAALINDNIGKLAVRLHMLETQQLELTKAIHKLIDGFTESL